MQTVLSVYMQLLASGLWVVDEFVYFGRAKSTLVGIYLSSGAAYRFKLSSGFSFLSSFTTKWLGWSWL
jgi:hypothetical protein